LLAFYTRTKFVGIVTEKAKGNEFAVYLDVDMVVVGRALVIGG
jgi:hypothetical protein